jgi:hypothetical protein
MNNVSNHGGMVVAVKHGPEGPLLQKWSEITLLDGAIHRLGQCGFRRQLERRKLDRFTDAAISLEERR